MKIKPNIYKFQNGSVPQWYIDRYGGRTSLNDWDLHKRYNFANKNLNTNGHRNAGDLNTVYFKNNAYTQTPGTITSDIQSFYDSDGNGMSAEDFVKYYNSAAGQIRSHWAFDRKYNDTNAGDHNRLFKRMFKSRSVQTQSPGSDYNIGYQDDQENIEGSSTWLRRMDQYEKEFDEANPDQNRLHTLNLKDGTTVQVYKKANGDIGIYNPVQKTEEQKKKDGSVPVGEVPAKQPIDLSKLRKYLPNVVELGRLAGTLNNNDKVYEAVRKTIHPVLQQSYTTHRQILGDEATRQGFYKRAAQGESRAARPFTSDADRQMAYRMETKRVGDELRAQGDLADNQEIRRTSDESNQHDWGNAQRATEVANFNNQQILDAQAKKGQLEAQKYSADWSSIDNYGLSLETRLREKQRKYLETARQLQMLQDQDLISNDETLLKLRKAVNDASDAYDKDPSEINNQRLQEAIRAYKSRQNFWQQQSLKNQLSFLARGGRVRRDSEEYLYRTSKEIVEHFRKMTKLTDDSRVSSRVHPIKLSSHPRKMQQGGVAPFTVFRPAAVGGETTTGSQATSSGKSSEKDPKLDLVKELFKNMSGKGLPIDIQMVHGQLSKLFKKAQLFGEEMTTDDIASIYINSMQQLNNLQHSQKVYERALQVATQNDALHEVAVTSSGKYIVQNGETGKLSEASLQEIQEKGLNPLTNEQLISMREYNPDLAFNKGDQLMNLVVNNGVGMSKISQMLNSLKGTLGSNEVTLEGYTKHEANEIRKGFELLTEAPAGDYEYSTYTKDQKQQMQQAFNYIKTMLPNNMKAVLQMNAFNQGTTIDNLIQNLLNAGAINVSKMEYKAVTGKASDKKNSNSSENDMLPSVAFFNGMGEKDQFIIQDKTGDGLKVNVISAPITSKGYNTGSITFDKLESSDFGGQLIMNQATMGDSLISPTGRGNIIIDGRIYQTELPIDKEAKAQGIIKPDLKFLRKIEQADQKLRQMGIDKSDTKNIPTINKVYQENGLPIVYSISNNKPILTQDYARFAIVNGIGTEDAFGENPQLNNSMVKEITGEKEREQFETMMQQQSGNAKYKLNNGFGIDGLFNWGETSLYQGTIYIPMATSNISALAGTGYKAKGDEYNEIEARQQAADAAREMGFTPAGDLSNLK